MLESITMRLRHGDRSDGGGFFSSVYSRIIINVVIMLTWEENVKEGMESDFALSYFYCYPPAVVSCRLSLGRQIDNIVNNNRRSSSISSYFTNKIYHPYF